MRTRFRPSLRGLKVSGTFAAALLLVSGPVFAQAKKAPAKVPAKAAASTNGAQPKFKAIWEPVNVKEDVELVDVYFVTPDEGWAAGGAGVMSGGIILHTKDGGTTWEIQVGDPHSSERGIRDLRFVNATHGWAVQGSEGNHKLLRTTDGQNWEVIGSVPEHRTDIRFVSATTGYYTSAGKIFRTSDSGKTWQPVYPCQAKVEVGGLTREVSCNFERLSFPSENVGYAASRNLAGTAGIALAKTEDGGATWNTQVILPGEDTRDGGFSFLDDNTGILRAWSGKLYRTADGGKTWTGVMGQPAGHPEVKFVDSEVGWMIGYRTMTYTTNGGKQWISREIGFPASVNAFCIVARDRGYAVGEHGMAYRYRVVPIEYTSKGMLAAPAMPARSAP